MKQTNPATGVLVLALVGSLCQAKEIEFWDFNASDGTQLRAIEGSQGTAFGSGKTPIAYAQDNQLLFTADGEEHSTFRIIELPETSPQGELYEFSWEFTSADFTNTLSAGGSGNIGFDYREAKDKENSELGAVRLRFDKKKLLLQAHSGGVDKFDTIMSIPGAELDKTLSLRVLIDLKNAGKRGSFVVFVKEGSSPEKAVYKESVIPAHAKAVKCFRIAHQTSNGGNNWLPGDTATVDNFKVAVLE